MNKKYSVFLTVLFCGFLGLFLAWHLILPDLDFSANENRVLSDLPTPTFGAGGNFFSGEFMQDFESYVNDQFPLRDGWVGLKARLEVLSGKPSNNGVYFAPGDILIADFPEPDPNRVDKNLGFVSTLGEKSEVPVWFSLIPGKSKEWWPFLPSGAPVGDQQAILDKAAQTENVTWIDISLPFDTSIDNRAYYSFYRTDHHWNTVGAYHGYADLMAGMGLTAQPLGTLTTVSKDFYGTTWSKAGAYWMTPDEMYIAVDDENVTVTGVSANQSTPGALYNYDKLETKDKYTFYLGGNQPLCVIESEKEGAEGSILILRDSFSDTLAPFLTQNFEEVHLMDLRYYKASIADYAVQNGIDQILVLYSVDNFVTDGNLFVMGM